LKKQIYFVLCLVPTILGTVIGWQVGEEIGIAALPPNAWAGDGMGILVQNIHGASWGALIGLGFGVACCLIWYFFARRRQSQKVAPQANPPDVQVWPPAPTQRP